MYPVDPNEARGEAGQARVREAGGGDNVMAAITITSSSNSNSTITINDNDSIITSTICIRIIIVK